MKERLYLFDTTLRDGQQTPGIDFSREDKLVIGTKGDMAGTVAALTSGEPIVRP